MICSCFDFDAQRECHTHTVSGAGGKYHRPASAEIKAARTPVQCLCLGSNNVLRVWQTFSLAGAAAAVAAAYATNDVGDPFRFYRCYGIIAQAAKRQQE